MNQDTEKKQCQICKGYLFDDDDIVICPYCGAPHHRDCWNAVGHCGLEEFHDTEKQYNRVQEEKEEEGNKDRAEAESRTCSYCGRTSNHNDGDFCPYCGQPYGKQGHNSNHGPQVFVNGMPFNNPNLYGGIPKDAKIEDVKVEHVAKFVGSNSSRYINKFATLNNHNKKSWNWTAFLFPSVWNFSRKMYVNGILYLMLSLAASLCFLPFQITMQTFDLEGLNSIGIQNLIRENIDAFSVYTWIFIGIGFLLNLVPRIISGIIGDWNYRKFALNKVKTILNNPDVNDLDIELLRKGNISFLGMMLGFLAEQNLPMLIATFII